MVFKQRLAALADTQINPALGDQAGISNADNSVGTPERGMLTSSAPGSSGGINLAAVSRGLGPGGGTERNAIRGGTLTQAASGIGTAAAASPPVSGGAGPRRTPGGGQNVFPPPKGQPLRVFKPPPAPPPTPPGELLLRPSRHPPRPRCPW